MYDKIFNASNLSNYQIKKRINISYTSVLQYRKTTKIDLTTIKRFSQLLGVSESDVVELIVGEIRNLYKTK